jgi:hypothetical protein
VTWRDRARREIAAIVAANPGLTGPALREAIRAATKSNWWVAAYPAAIYREEMRRVCSPTRASAPACDGCAGEGRMTVIPFPKRKREPTGDVIARVALRSLAASVTVAIERADAAATVCGEVGDIPNPSVEAFAESVKARLSALLKEIEVERDSQ